MGRRVRGPGVVVASEVRVLVVDDDRNATAIFCRWLSQKGLRVDGVHDVASAQGRLEAAHAMGEPYHVVVLDFLLREATCVDLLEWTQRLPRPPGVVLATGFWTEAVLAIAEWQTVGRVRKPANELELYVEVVEGAGLVLRCWAERDAAQAENEARFAGPPMHAGPNAEPDYETLEAVLHGLASPPFTPRESEVLHEYFRIRRTGEGARAELVATRLGGISVHTVRTHIRRILAKTRAISMDDLFHVALRASRGG